MPKQNEPTFAQATREQEEREVAQKPLFAQFKKCKTLDKLGPMLAKHKATYDIAPWVAWICNGPGDDKKWTEVRGKTDAKKQTALVKVLSDLIKKGAELAVIDEEAHYGEHALALILAFDELTPKQRLKLVELAIEHGADPAERIAYPLWASEQGPFCGYRVTRSALDVAIADDEHPEFLKALAAKVSKGALDDAYLRYAINQIDTSRPDVPAFVKSVDRAGKKLDRIVTKLGDTESGALVHFLCDSEVTFEAFDAVIDRLDASLPLPGPFTVQVSTEWGLVPTIRLPQGATPLDIVDGILGFVTRAEATNAKKPDKSFRADNCATIRTNATKKRERLLAKGAKKSERGDQIDLPPVLAETGEQILRLAKLVGTDPAPIKDAMASVDTDGMGAWGFLHAIVPPFESELVTPKLESPALVQLLTAFSSDRWSKQLSKRDLPANKRSSVEVAVVFDRSDDASLLAVKTGGGTQIWKLADDEVTVVAPSVPDYLKTEIDRWQA